MSQGDARRRAQRLGVGPIIALLLLIPAWTASADTPGTSPVAVGVPVTFSGNGFNARESLTLWANTADGAVTTLPSIQTDATGAFTTTISFPFPGQWHVIAHGMTTNKYFDNVYTVEAGGGTPSTGTAPQTGQAATATATATAAGTGGTPVAVGAATTFTTLGFDANETVALWETAPGGSVTALPNTTADSTGKVTVSISFPTAGQWQVTAHGASSGKDNIGTYAVGATDTTTTPSNPPSTSTNAAPATQTVANASQVIVGTTTPFYGTGFTANEAISLWETGPGGIVVPVPSVQADSTGAFNAAVSFQPVGYWQVTAQGRTSGHSIVAAFNVTGASTS